VHSQLGELDVRIEHVKELERNGNGKIPAVISHLRAA
jgi:hypothetical protein